MGTTGTALVNTRTPNALPDDQKKGNYSYTPPEVLAYLAGESLSVPEMDIVLRHYGDSLPPVGPPPERATTMPPAFAAPYGVEPVASGRCSASGGKQNVPKRLVKKVQEEKTPSDLLNAVEILVELLDEESANSVLLRLADRFNLEIE